MKLYKSILTAIFSGLLVIGLAACEKEPAEEAAEAASEAVEATEEAVSAAAEATEEAVEAAQE
jgi:hypothetical protein